MAEYIEREAFIAQKRNQYCGDCDRRKGMKNGKMRFCYDIGDAPCRACGIDDMLNDVEDFLAADVAPVRRGRWHIVKLPPSPGYKAKECSECKCNFWDLEEWNFCPNCGAKMEVDE